MNNNKQLAIFIIAGVLFSLLLATLLMGGCAKKQSEEYIGKQETTKEETKASLKSRKFKGKELSQEEWNNKKSELVGKMKTYISKNKKDKLLGASDDLPQYNDIMSDLSDWTEIANGEACFYNLDIKDKTVVGWDLIEYVNNLLENNQC